MTPQTKLIACILKVGDGFMSRGEREKETHYGGPLKSDVPENYYSLFTDLHSNLMNSKWWIQYGGRGL